MTAYLRDELVKLENFFSEVLGVDCNYLRRNHLRTACFSLPDANIW
jgi:hypothetical protein